MRITTSRKEIIDITKAWLAITVAFAIVLRSGIGILESLLVSAIAVGLGFLLHELGHKIVAQYYRCFAEFRSFDSMLLLAIAMSFFGFVFAAPGAVMIHGYVNRERNGKISIAGPSINIALALIFLFLTFIFGSNIVLLYGFRINVWLALFNLIPFGNFDGSKIFRWNKKIYWIFAALCIGLFLI
ncbi:site-2 protease family protein [Candidatus Woesearchaeota archaeon]|nr:site-2 protease family protein [Candidatus Woesearchaeota archaeon]